MPWAMPNAKLSRKWWYETSLTLVRCSGLFFWRDENLNKFQNYLSSMLSLTWELYKLIPTGYVRNSNLFFYSSNYQKLLGTSYACCQRADHARRTWQQQYLHACRPSNSKKGHSKTANSCKFIMACFLTVQILLVTLCTSRLETHIMYISQLIFYADPVHRHTHI